MAALGQKLYRLQLLDTELSEQLSRLREAEGLAGETRELVEARAAHERATSEVAASRTLLNDLEFELQRLVDRIAATEARLYGGQVTNPKELHGLQQDHDYLKRSHRKLEDDVLLAMTRLEDGEKELAVVSNRLTDVETRWHAEQSCLTKQIEQLQTKVATLKKERSVLAKPLDASARGLYEDLLRKKGGRAVVLLVGQMCEGCRVTLPSSKAQSVRRAQELVTCTNCGRILVVEQ